MVLIRIDHDLKGLEKVNGLAFSVSPTPDNLQRQNKIEISVF